MSDCFMPMLAIKYHRKDLIITIYIYIYLSINTRYFSTQLHTFQRSQNHPRDMLSIHIVLQTRMTENLQYYYSLGMEGETIHKTTIL